MPSSAVINLSPPKVDLLGIRAGDRNLINATLRLGGQPLNLAGITVTAQARKKATDEDPPALTAEITVLDSDAGKVSIRWPGDDVRALLNGDANWAGAWDMQITQGSEDPLTICAGKFSADTDVTR